MEIDEMLNSYEIPFSFRLKYTLVNLKIETL